MCARTCVWCMCVCARVVCVWHVCGVCMCVVCVCVCVVCVCVCVCVVCVCVYVVCVCVRACACVPHLLKYKMTPHHKHQFSEQYSLTTRVKFVCIYKEIPYFQMTNYKKLLVLYSGTYGTLLSANTWPLGLFVCNERCIFTIFLYSSGTITHNSHFFLPIPYSQCYNFYTSISSQCHHSIFLRFLHYISVVEKFSTNTLNLLPSHRSDMCLFFSLTNQSFHTPTQNQAQLLHVHYTE
jgi:hypothetical protein